MTPTIKTVVRYGHQSRPERDRRRQRRRDHRLDDRNQQRTVLPAARGRRVPRSRRCAVDHAGSDHPDNFTLAGDARGDVIAAWYGFDMSAMHNVVRAAVKPAGSNAFGASQIISSKTNDSVQPVVTLDRNGDGVVGMQLGNSPAGISVAVLRRLAPTTRQAERTDEPEGRQPPPPCRSRRWTVLRASTVSWSFGDGSASASGTHVSHKFDNVGRFTVKVTATDRAGNSSSATLIVNVTAPPNRCVVPRLKGKTLSQAKTALKKAHCKLGTVHKPKKPKHRKLRKLVVKSSSPGAGKIRPAGTKVKLTLAEVPKKKHK